MWRREGPPAGRDRRHLARDQRGDRGVERDRPRVRVTNLLDSPVSPADGWRRVEARLLALLNGRSASQVAKSLRAMIKRHALNASAAKPVKRAARCLVNNSQLLPLRPRARRGIADRDRRDRMSLTNAARYGDPLRRGLADRDRRDRGCLSLSRAGPDGPHRCSLCGEEQRGMCAFGVAIVLADTVSKQNTVASWTSLFAGSSRGSLVVFKFLL